MRSLVPTNIGPVNNPANNPAELGRIIDGITGRPK